MELSTLLERLKPEPREKIKNLENRYPSLSKRIKDALSTKYFLRDIEFGTVLNIADFAEVSILEVHEIFYTFKEYEDDNTI